jgi:hypothetical protein
MVVALKKKTESIKSRHHRTISPIVHAANIVAKIPSRKIERKIEDALGEDQFGWRKKMN